MPRIKVELSPLAVKRLSKPGFHRVGGARGLGLQIKVGEDGATSSKSWVLRYMAHGKNRDLGLGPLTEVSLAEAREKGRVVREQLREGRDPIDERKAARSAAVVESGRRISFKEAAEKYIKAHEKSWTNEKHSWQWTQTLTAHAFPVIGQMLVADIDVQDVVRVLEPIWLDKNETASRLRGRMENVLDWAKTQKFRTGDNPARWKGTLEHMLVAPGAIQVVEHYPAVMVGEVGAFAAALRLVKGASARCLELVLLTATRSAEARLAQWPEFDLDNPDGPIWVIPASRMKARTKHRVPLSPAAVRLLKALPRQPPTASGDFVFVTARGKPPGDMAMTQLMRRMGFVDVDDKVCVPHGLRSTFRDWCGDRTDYPRELAEQALAHGIEDEVEAAYRRGDMLAKRRAMMRAWATFCAKVENPAAKKKPAVKKKPATSKTTRAAANQAA